MSVSVKVLDGGRFLRAVYHGRENFEGEMEIADKLLEAIEATGCSRILHDCRAVTGPRLGTVDAFAAASAYDRRFLSVRSALLDHPQHYRENRFWETAVLNQGFTAKVFEDEKKAIAWLLDEEAED